MLHWLAARRLDGLWIIPDEAIYGLRGLALYRHGTLSIVHGEGAGYGVLYPILAGLPLSFGSLERGYHSLKLLQALAMSLAAAPVFFWGRRLMSGRYALLAALLTVASPLLLYSGLLMTEVLFYPVAAAALLTIARAVETGRSRHQAIALLAILAALLTRVQAVVLVGVFAAAIVLEALLAREPRRVRRFPVVWAVLAASALGAVLAPGLFGSYAEVARGAYPLTAAGRLTLDHAAWVTLSTGVLPVAALALLVVAAARTREPDAAVRAYLAVAVPALVLVVLQIGLFASRYAPHLLERDLAALPPVLFVGFALWLSRGAPRPRSATAAVVLVTAGLLVAVSWPTLVAANALPDTFSLPLLYRLRHHDPATIVAVTAGAALLALAFVPRALRLALAAPVLALLVAGSVVTADQVAPRIRFEQVHLVGQPRDWIDHAAHGPVTYVYDGDRFWNGVWQAMFWNERIAHVVTVRPTRVPGPLPQREVTLAANGAFGSSDRYAVASDAHTFVGTPVAHVELDGTESGGLTLWRLEGRARLATVQSGIFANGDMNEPAQLVVYDCAGGRLELTLLPKATRVVTIALNGRTALRATIAGKPYYNAAVGVPASPHPRVCHFTIVGQKLLGSTRIAFVRAS